jgi:glycosyltransferase involved in cell wall biosynthesis
MLQDGGSCLNILLYPNNFNRTGGPWNVIRYLTEQFSQRMNMYNYPSLTERQDCGNQNFLGSLIKTWTRSNSVIDIAHFLITPTLENGSLPYAFAAKTNKIPTVLNIHRVISLEEQTRDIPVSHLKHLRAKTRTSIASQAMKKIVVNSKFMVKNVALGYGIDPDKITVIPNGVNLKLFDRQTKKIFLDGDPAILYIGRLTYAKGILTLIQAVALAKKSFPKIKLHCVGHSSVTASDLQSKISELHLTDNVILHDWVSQEDISSYYKAADFCIFPSQLESFGLVVLEAMASGAPLILSNIPAFREIVQKEKSGLFFNVGNEQELANSITRLASDFNLRKRLVENASRDVLSYDWANIAEKYVELYKSILN